RFLLVDGRGWLLLNGDERSNLLQRFVEDFSRPLTFRHGNPDFQRSIGRTEGNFPLEYFAVVTNTRLFECPTNFLEDASLDAAPEQFDAIILGFVRSLLRFSLGRRFIHQVHVAIIAPREPRSVFESAVRT